MQNNFYHPALHSSKRRAAWIVILILAVLLIGAFFILDFSSKQEALSPLEKSSERTPVSNDKLIIQPKDALNQQVVDVSGSSAAINALIKKLGKHIFLPTGKVTVTTVVDAEALRKENPIFYQYAKKGDRVVIYPTQAILYDPVLDMVLDVVHFSATAPAPKK